MPTLAIGVAKKLVHNVIDKDLEANFQATAYAYHLLSHTDDYGEGVAAFEEKREPRFSGR